jgi:DNA replication protein DnaC
MTHTAKAMSEKVTSDGKREARRGGRQDGPQLRSQLTELLKELCLPAVRACYEETARLAVQEALSYEQFLLEVCTRESEMRRHNKIERLLRQSRLPLEKTWDGFDRSRLPSRVRHQANSLLDGSFLDRQENILAFGNPGSGKTHLLCGLGQELVRQGRRVLYTTCSLLVQELLVAKRDLTLSRLLRRLSGFEGLIIDDLGYVQQSREEMEVLFTLLADRYERGSVLITSNLPFSQWESIFKDPMTTAAAIDRLVHHSVILELNLPSYRVEQAKKSKGASAPADGSEGNAPQR